MEISNQVKNICLEFHSTAGGSARRFGRLQSPNFPRITCSSCCPIHSDSAHAFQASSMRRRQRDYDSVSGGEKGSHGAGSPS